MTGVAGVVVLVLVGLAVASWLSAAVHGFWSLAHLSGRRSIGQMLFQGIQWFNAENFNPRGRVLQRRFARSCVAFLVCVLGTALVSTFVAR
jgi:hypothetical protein